MSNINDLRIAAKVAVREARNAENLACYFDGLNDTRAESEHAYNDALKAIDALAAAVESAGGIEQIMEVTK